MNKHLLIAASLLAPLSAWAQGAFDAYQISQSDLKGTARYMSMGGAFGALGGDLSSLGTNPAGIGVYRRSEIGFTLDLDAQSAKATSGAFSNTTNQTKFLLNNIGVVGTMRLPSTACPNLNIGFTYNKAASFNRRYSGGMGNILNSMTNYVAGVANAEGATPGDLHATNTYNPYFPNDGGYAPEWISVLGYQGYMINNAGTDEAPRWEGQMGDATKGSAYFDMLESGHIDEYNIALGGNIANVVYWGMDFGITDLSYTLKSIYGENLTNAYVDGQSGMASDWNMYNYYRVKGTGFNYKIGLIVKPIQALRIGFAVHTPTWYALDETFYGDVEYNFANANGEGSKGLAQTNDGYDAYNNYKFRSPWKFMVSAAGVIGSRMIISADYEWTSYSTMKYSVDRGGDWYYDDPWDYDPWYKPAKINSLDSYDTYGYTNGDIKNYFTSTSTLRIGAEFRVTPQFSVRAGYSYVSSPVKAKVADNQEPVYTVGTRPQYSVDRETQYITCGLGYKYQKFYVDAAYVYKHRTSDFHAFTPDATYPSPQARISDNNSQIVLSMGFKF